MKKFLREIHRRSMWQILGIYAVSSWVVFQVAQTLTEGLGLPAWVPPLALILLLVGLPIVLMTACVQKGIRGAPAPTARPFADAGQGETLVEPVDAAPAVPAESGVEHRIFTWRNALLGGAGAFLLLFGFFQCFFVLTSGLLFFPHLLANGALLFQFSLLLLLMLVDKLHFAQFEIHIFGGYLDTVTLNQLVDRLGCTANLVERLRDVLLGSL